LERIADNPAAVERGAELRARFGHPLVLFVGRLIYYKGIEVLARAIPEVAAQFVLIGRGPDRTLLEALAASDPALAARIHLIDYADAAELAAWYHAADLLVLPSIEPSEAFGLVQIEAHAAATTVVSTRLKTGVPYANLDGVTGLTVEPRNADALAGALNALLADPDLRTRLGRQAQARALAEFSAAHMIESVLAVYAEALALKPAAPPAGEERRP
jgi:rhamnosyl/mannosyltransferase